MLRIMDENGKLLKRLQGKSANYSTKQWAIDDAKNFERVQKLQEYPSVFRNSAHYTSMSMSKMSLNNTNIRRFNKTQLSQGSLMSKDLDEPVIKYSGEANLGTDFFYDIVISRTREK